MKVFWKPHAGPQEEALRRSETEILYGGARGGGKTDAGQVWLIEPEYVNNPRYRFLVIRKNHKDLSDWIDRARIMYSTLKVDTAGRELRFPSGAVGRTGHLKDKNAFSQYIGHEYHKLLIEELTLIPSFESYEKLLSSCRSTVPGLKPQVFATTNPGNAGHIWVKDRFVKHGPYNPYQDPDSDEWRIFIPSTVYDNPTLMENDPAYERRLRAIKDEKLRRAWLDGDWDVFEGQFFDMWDEKIHVYKSFKIPKEWPRFRAIDWGYSDYFCCLWFAVGPDNHIWVYREFYRNRMTDGEYAESIRMLSKYDDGSDERIAYTVGDPSSFSVTMPDTGKTRFETFAYNGVSVIPADNNRVEGWSRVREYLEVREYQGRPSSWVHISEDCPNLIRTLPSLVHHERKVEDIEDGMEDHAPDTFRYGLRSRPPLFDKKPKTGMTNLQAAERQMERKLARQGDRWA